MSSSRTARPVLAPGQGQTSGQYGRRVQRAACRGGPRHPARVVHPGPRLGTLCRWRRPPAAEGRLHRVQHALSALGQAGEGTGAVRHLARRRCRSSTRCRTPRRSIAGRRWSRGSRSATSGSRTSRPAWTTGRFPTSRSFPQPATLYAMSPHMHLRGKDMKFTVTYPDGREEVVLDVPKYDFNWQLYYELATPLKLPAGQQAHRLSRTTTTHRRTSGTRRPTRKCSGRSRAGMRCTTRRSGGPGICRMCRRNPPPRPARQQ